MTNSDNVLNPTLHAHINQLVLVVVRIVGVWQFDGTFALADRALLATAEVAMRVATMRIQPTRPVAVLALHARSIRPA